MPQGGGAPELPNFGDSRVFMRTSLTQKYHIWGDNAYGEGLVSKESATPPPQGAGSQRFPILGFLSTYAYILWRRATKFDNVTHVGRGLKKQGWRP